MNDLAGPLLDVTENFSGVVSVSRGTSVEFEAAYGLADRAHGILVQLDTQFGLASATKGFTALAVAALIGDGVLELSTTARSVLGRDLPLVHPDVTVAHLLGHTSGIGDYVDEDSGSDIEDHVLRVPVHTLDTTEGYVVALDGFAQKFPPGARFSYCNSGYVLLAVIAERVSGRPFPGLVGERVFSPAEMRSTAFLRSDRLPGTAAVGYLGDGRTNVLHLPVRGSGDGGAYSNVADVRAFWNALFGERILPRRRVTELTRPRHAVPTDGMRYGHGFWLHPTGPAVILEGCDAGVSFRSVHDPTSGRTHTVLANTSDGAWPITRRLGELVR